MKVGFLSTGRSESGSHRIQIEYLSELLNERDFVTDVSGKFSDDWDVAILGKDEPREWVRDPTRIRCLVGKVSPSPAALQKGRFPIDFAVVGSIEERESCLAVRDLPCLLFPLIEPGLQDAVVKRQDTASIQIGYHGNVQHLRQVPKSHWQVFERLNTERPLRICLIYDATSLGHFEPPVSSHVAVSHVQWKRESFQDDIQACQVGWAPSVSKMPWISKLAIGLGLGDGNRDDVSSRFKRTHNPGRALLMSQLGLPVVAEACQSHFELYGQERSGFLYNSAASMFQAFQRLIASSELRESQSRCGSRNSRVAYDAGEWADAFAIRLRNLVIHSGRR